jgi:thiamine biosynthesis lipoprotein
VIGVPVRTEVLMGTIVTIHVVSDDGAADSAIDRAFGWFREIEARCTKFDPGSELRQLALHVGRAVPVSPIVFEAVSFALAVARDTDGAFDPTTDGAFRDIDIDSDARTIALRRALTIDLGAVAKGLAVDAGARELQPFGDFAIDAGGDLYLGGRNPTGGMWTVGIRHPREDGLIETLRVTDAAVCTSGDYERPGHIVDPKRRTASDGVASVTVVAPNATIADALGTAAFVLGPEEGLRLFERHGVEGLIVGSNFERFETPGLPKA